MIGISSVLHLWFLSHLLLVEGFIIYPVISRQGHQLQRGGTISMLYEVDKSKFGGYATRRATPLQLHTSSVPGATTTAPSKAIPSTATTIVSTATAITSSISNSNSQLSPLEDWCAREVEEWYQRAVSVKCPFFKRRFVDALDGVDMVLRFLVIRHKSLDIFGPPPGHRSKFQTDCCKIKDLTADERLEAIRRDWRPDSSMGYYITGNLNTTIFRDDCLFAGPDPDMPVRGLRKYLNAASQLFDRSQSRAELLSLAVVVVRAEGDTTDDDVVVVAKWRMNGVLRLPWKPTLPEWTGSTTYHFDNDGLVYLHDETWDMSVWQAFMKTFAPDLAQRIWPNVEPRDLASPTAR